MQTRAAESRRQPGLGRPGESRQGPGGPPGTQPGARRSQEDAGRMKEIKAVSEKKGRHEEEERGMGGGQGGGGELGSLRLDLHQLQKENLDLLSAHNQEVCRLQAELARLRSQVERGQAQQVELRYRLSVEQRDGQRLSRDRSALAERAAQLQQTVQELQKVLDLTQRGREEDQRAQQQEVEERDALMEELTSENQRLHQLLQDQEEALKQLDRRMEEVHSEREKEAELKEQLSKELKHLREEEEESTREKEAAQAQIRSLEQKVEAERSAHLETRLTCQLLQLRGQDLQAALDLERSGQQEALCTAALLGAQLQTAQRASSLERERKEGAEQALERLQRDLQDIKSNLEREKLLTSDLSQQLEEEQRGHVDTQQRWRQMLADVRELLLNHTTGTGSDGGPAEVLQLLKTTLSTGGARLEAASKQVQDLTHTLQKLQEENQALRQLTCEQLQQVEDSQQEVLRLQEGLAHLGQDAAAWSRQLQDLQAELERERQERRAEEEAQEEAQEEARLGLLHRVHQRLLAAGVLLDQPQSPLANLTWEELCDVITQQVDRLTSDLQKANEKVDQLQSVCDRRSVCVLQLQRSQECFLSGLEDSLRSREEVWRCQHAHTEAELQACRSERAVVQDRASSLQQRLSSLTSNLRRRRSEASSLLCAAGLLAGALRHAHRCLSMLRQQKAQLCRRLAEKEALEEEVRRLAAALGGQEEQEEQEEGRGAARRWRRLVWALVAAHRWSTLARRTTVLFQVEVGGGGAAVGVCGGWTPEAQRAPPGPWEQFIHLLQSRGLSSTLLLSVEELQGALARSGPSPQDVAPALRSALPRLLGHLLSQSPAEVCSGSELAEAPDSAQPAGRPTTTLGSALQQHFLLLSQRLHSAEVERRSLRMEVANLRRGRGEEGEEGAARRFHSVWAELSQALGREQEAQRLLQEQTNQLLQLQRRASAHAAQQRHARDARRRLAQALSRAQQEDRRKERSLRTLGPHLSHVHRDRKQLAQRLRRVQEELSAAARCSSSLLSTMRAAASACLQAREGLSQSQPSTQLRPLRFPTQHLETTREEADALQSLLSSFSLLYGSCCSRMSWQERAVSLLRGHVTVLRRQLQDGCLGDVHPSVPVSPERVPSAVTRPPVPSSSSPQAKPASCRGDSAPSPALAPRVKPKRSRGRKTKTGSTRSPRRSLEGGAPGLDILEKSWKDLNIS